MTDYVKSTNFTSKDSLASGNPLKIVKGTEFDIEFNNIAVAVATKADVLSPALTGTPTAPTATAGTNTAQVATTSFVGTAVSAYDAALTVSTAQIEDDAVTAAKLASSSVTSSKLATGVAVSNLGFTPVQQGTGTGQLSNTVKIGWDGSNLRLEVDETNFYSTWPINLSTTSILNATAAATVGAVGTYAYLRWDSSTSITEGSTTSGSNLRFSGVNSDGSGNSIASTGGTPSGTWRAMGSTTSGYANGSSTLWLRIS